jgi:hypothetical protein
MITLASCSSGQVKQSDEGWTEATGVAAIVDGEVGKAKDDALNDAKVSAVKQVLGTMIKSRTDVDSGVFQSSELSAKAEGFIEKYEVLKQKAVSQYEYQVTIRARVSEYKLGEAIEEMISRQGRPIMMVMMQETLSDGKTSTDQTIAGTEIESVYTEKGFPFVDRSTLADILKKQNQKVKKALGGNQADARDLGELAGAEIVIIGTSTVDSAGKIQDSNLISMQADVSIRAIEVATGSILGANQEHGAYPHINEHTGAVEAIKKAVKLASDKNIDIITKKWKAGKSNIIDILVIGMDYDELKKLNSEMQDKIRGIRAIHRKGSEGKVAKMQVEFEGTSFTLADRISDAKLSFQFKMGEVQRNSIEMTRK